jgi:hypothetical protein
VRGRPAARCPECAADLRQGARSARPTCHTGHCDRISHSRPCRPSPACTRCWITCEIDASCDSDIRIRRSKSHNASKSHVNPPRLSRDPPPEPHQQHTHRYPAGHDPDQATAPGNPGNAKRSSPHPAGTRVITTPDQTAHNPETGPPCAPARNALRGVSCRVKPLRLPRSRSFRARAASRRCPCAGRRLAPGTRRCPRYPHRGRGAGLPGKP